MPMEKPCSHDAAQPRDLVVLVHGGEGGQPLALQPRLGLLFGLLEKEKEFVSIFFSLYFIIPYNHAASQTAEAPSTV